MSMSQEDIEALMNGLDIPAQDSVETIKEEPIPEDKVNTKEIEALLSQVEKNEDKDSLVSPASEKKISEIGELLNDIEDDDLSEDVILENSSSLSSQIEETVTKSNKSDDDIVKEWSSSKISEGVFPFPAENDTKVVSQLSQVANDSEEKVSQIFDVLSLTLDNNSEIRKSIKSYEEFILSQNKLLNSLSNKFPKIGVFQEQLEKVNYTLSSQIDELADGSQAIFVGKIENITEKISKKGNKFGIATIMDLHGNIELMLFEDRLKELKESYNLEEPIAFKVRISKDENFTRMNILKIESIKEAKNEKIKTKQKGLLLIIVNYLTIMK